MPKAALLRVNRGGEWLPRAVFLGTRKGLQARALPGDPDLDAFLRTVLQGAQKPARPDGTPGTWEDWCESAVYDLTNWYDRVCVSVDPEITLKQLYQREVLGITPESITSQRLQPVSTVPDLHGWRVGTQNPKGLPQ